MAVIYFPAYVNPANLLDSLDKGLRLSPLAIEARWLLTVAFSLSTEFSVYFSPLEEITSAFKRKCKNGWGVGEVGGVGEAEGGPVNSLQPERQCWECSSESC